MDSLIVEVFEHLINEPSDSILIGIVFLLFAIYKILRHFNIFFGKKF
jgi:hypothetical protein